MSSFVTAAGRSVSGKITRSGLEICTSRPPASTKASVAAISGERPRVDDHVGAVALTGDVDATAGDQHEHRPLGRAVDGARRKLALLHLELSDHAIAVDTAVRVAHDD